MPKQWKEKAWAMDQGVSNGARYDLDEPTMMTKTCHCVSAHCK